MVSPERLKELLHYDPETGVFTRRIPRGAAKKGRVAGSERYGRPRAMIDGRQYLLHRLAWLYVHGSLPIDQIDHINGDTTDNRIANLREATPSQNTQNQRAAHSDNMSGFLGVSWEKDRGKWLARIFIDGEQKYLGRFNCPTSAYLLGYLPAKRKLHQFQSIC
jgi:hypothetical protein